GDGADRPGAARRAALDRADRPEHPPRRGGPGAVRAGEPRRGLPRDRPAVRADPGPGGTGRLMDFLSPTSLDDALAAKAAHPDAVPILGGTDVMVELNFDRHRPPVLLDLTRVPELATWERAGGEIRLGAGVTYARVIRELAAELPGLAL